MFAYLSRYAEGGSEPAVCLVDSINSVVSTGFESHVVAENTCGHGLVYECSPELRCSKCGLRTRVWCRHGPVHKRSAEAEPLMARRSYAIGWPRSNLWATGHAVVYTMGGHPIAGSIQRSKEPERLFRFSLAWGHILLVCRKLDAPLAT